MNVPKEYGLVFDFQDPTQGMIFAESARSNAGFTRLTRVMRSRKERVYSRWFWAIVARFGFGRREADREVVMLNKVLEYVAKWSIGGKVVSGIGWVHDILDGKKTEIFSGIYALSYVLEVAGILPTPTAEQWRTALIIVVPVAFADRASKIAASLKKVAGQ